MADRTKLADENFKEEGGDWYVIHVTKKVKEQILDDYDIVANLGVNPRQLIQENKVHAESFRKILNIMNSIPLGDKVTDSVAIQMIIAENDKVNKKLDIIEKYAQKLVYMQPGISWQLKQILRNEPRIEPPKPKPKVIASSNPNYVTYLVSCSKCPFDQIHEEKSLEIIKKYHEGYNHDHAESMTCVHEYQYKLFSTEHTVKQDSS